MWLLFKDTKEYMVNFKTLKVNYEQQIYLEAWEKPKIYVRGEDSLLYVICILPLFHDFQDIHLTIFLLFSRFKK